MPEEEKIYIDEPCVASFFIGEMGWIIQRWAGYLRHLKHDVYPDHKFIIMINLDYHVFVHDFVTYTIPPPKEFLDLKLETDCYEAPAKGSVPGSLTPPEVWTALVKYFRNFYNVEEAEEIWTPRGCNTWVDKRPQIFQRFAAAPVKADKPIIVVFPRGRARSSQRNVPEFVWRELVDKLRRDFIVILGGTPSGSFLSDYQGENVVNLINYNGSDKMDQIIGFLNSATMSVSSQSGSTHISLLSGCPSYIIGHEKERHAVVENRLSIPVSFRVLQDYRAIDSVSMFEDIKSFESVLSRLTSVRDLRMNRPSLRNLQSREELVGAEIGVYAAANSLNILQNLDIKRLYLIDPYKTYGGLAKVGGTESDEDFRKVKEYAHKVLSQFEDKIVWIEDFSSTAVDKIDEELDFVYIDANHEYEYVKKDLISFYPKVKDGGLIAGHDYDEGDEEKNGVIQAVNEFFKDRKLEVFHAAC